MKMRFHILVVSALILGLAACTSSGSGSVQSVTITKVPSPASLNVGDTLNLDVTVQATGQVDRAVDWASDAPSVATVDADGVVTGIAAGTVVVSATSRADAGKSDSVTLTVVSAGNRRPIADAGLDVSVVASPSADVSLDGSGSSDPDGDTLSYAWTLDSAPSGSGATLAGASGATPTFKADLAGDYAFTLQVSDGQLTATDSVTVTATCPAPITKDVTITAPETWGVNVGNCPDYRVTGFLQVDAALTIEPGTHVEFEANAGLWAPAGNGGSIQAVGTASQQIRFDGTDSTPGFWRSISIDEASPLTELTYVTVDGGGGAAINQADILVSNSGTLKMTHSVVSHSAKTGIYVADGTSQDALHDFAMNVYRDNGDAPLDLPSSALGGLDAGSDYNPSATPNARAYINVRRGFLASSDATWPAANVPYHLQGYTRVQSAHTLTIEPGADLEFEASGAYISVEGGSTLVATGTAGSPIRFHGPVAGQQGQWGGLRFLNASYGNTLDHVEVSGGGYGGAGQADVLLSGSGETVALGNSTIADSAGWGVYVGAGNTVSPADPTTSGGNTFSNNALGDVGP